MIPTGSEHVAEVVIGREVEEAAAWVFEVTIRRGAAGETRHELRLSWADYEYWSHGTVAPERVAKAVVEVAVERRSDPEMPGRFDASTVRRWGEGIDAAVTNRLHGAG